MLKYFNYKPIEQYNNSYTDPEAQVFTYLTKQSTGTAHE
jgi:hypothetical protein